MSAAWRIAESNAPEPGAGASGIASLVKGVAANVHAWAATRRARRRMLRQLSQLDDRLLRDIGVGRKDLGYAAGELHGLADMLRLLTERREHF